MSAVLTLYRLATGLLEPFTPMILRGRIKRGKEDPARLGERLGVASAVRPEGPLAWFHGASVGESLSLLPIIERFRQDRPEVSVLVTSGTTTAAEILGKRLPEGAIHQYVPVDAPGAARRFLDHWRPDLAVFAESDLWPNLLTGARLRHARLALVSARIGAGSASDWARAPGAAAELFGGFDLILPQDDESAERLSGLGARDDGRLNLKWAGSPLPVDEAVLADTRALIGKRPVLVAASTHPGEDEIVLDAFGLVLTHKPKALLIIVPRHPVRGADILALARAKDYQAGRRALGDAPTPNLSVYVADTLGELGLWFRLATTAFIGGSLVPDIGGHNPLEATRLDCPAISGLEVDTWRSIYERLYQADAVEMVADAGELGRTWRQGLWTPKVGKARAARARELDAAEAARLDAAVAQLEALLP